MKYKAPFHARPPASASPHPARVPQATGSHPTPRQRWMPQAGRRPAPQGTDRTAAGDGQPALRLGGTDSNAMRAAEETGSNALTHAYAPRRAARLNDGTARRKAESEHYGLI